jgi:hypothetical protein
MEDLLVKVLFVIDRSVHKKLSNLKYLIDKNRIEFNQLKFEKQQLQSQVMDLYCKEDSEASISEQIGFIFRVVENDVNQESLLDFDINKVIDKTNPSINVKQSNFIFEIRFYRFGEFKFIF